MGANRFERRPEILGGKNVIEFDSSHDRAIARAFGWAEGSIDIRETGRDGDARIFYDVYARDHGVGKPLTKRGVMTSLTPMEIRRRQEAGLDWSPRK